MASNIGATLLSETANELQAALHAGATEQLEELLSSAESRLVLVNQAITEFLLAK
ncbi:hypothetical protein D3C86_2259800 [compost metagenome]